MFFGTDFDRVTLFMVRLPALLISANLEASRSSNAPSQIGKVRAELANCQSVRNGDTQTAPACASFILGHWVLGWGVAQ